MNAVLEQLEKIGIVPVVKIDDAKKAVPLAKALEAGGIPCAEITFRTEAGQEAIRQISREMPQILVGAGTVLTKKQVDEALDAGAKFIVSPGYNSEVVSYCIECGVPITPGCVTPSDMERAMEAGLDVVKFFPAEQSGGLAYIQAVAAPYTKLRFMPTGGINTKNLNEYLAYNKIVACGGSWMVKDALINEERFDEIEKLCREAVSDMLAFEIAHIGVNAQNEQQAIEIAKQFELLFGFVHKVGNSSVFAGTAIEVMKNQTIGRLGHIAIATNSVLRAMYSLEQRGFSFKKNEAKINTAGIIIGVYLEQEIAGFAIHLLQK